MNERPQPAPPQAAADHAYREHHDAIYRYLLRKTRDHHDAEELTQRVFADASAGLSSEKAPPESVLAWLYAVAERRFVDEIRRRTVARGGLRLLPRKDEAPDLTYSREVARALRRAIDRLPADQQQVVIMKVLEGRPFAEIAKKVCASEAACKMRLSRAVARLKKELSEQGLAPDG